MSDPGPRSPAHGSAYGCAAPAEAASQPGVALPTSARQLRLLVQQALRMDFRERNPLGARRRRRGRQGFLWGIAFHALAGTVTATFALDLPAPYGVALLLVVGSVYTFFSLVVEYQQILLAPVEADILAWRPIPECVRFLARILHVLLYTGILQAAFMLAAMFLVPWRLPGPALPVAGGFVLAVGLNLLFTVAVTVVLHGVALRHVAGDRLQDVLVALQVGMGIFVFLGYQMVGPAVEWLARQPEGLHGLHALPATWFAAWSHLASGSAGRAEVLEALAGLAIVLVAGGLALPRLGPAYLQGLEALDAGGAPAPAASPSRWVRLESALARAVSRDPLFAVGCRFFLAHLRRDRQVKMTLWPLVILPMALTLFALVRGVAGDPYAGTGGTLRVAGRSGFLVYLAPWWLAVAMMNLPAMIRRSPDWRAAWVFHVAPLRRFEVFHNGVLFGALYALILPTLLLLLLVLSLLWGHPLHAMAHVLLPLAVGMLGMAFTLRLEPAAPFSREPVRHEAGRDFIVQLVAMLPAAGAGVAQFLLRDHVATLVLSGAAGILLGLFLVSRSARSLGRTLRGAAFDAA